MLQVSGLAAVRTGDSVSLSRLLDCGLDCDVTFQLGGGARPALCVAAEGGHCKVVLQLLARWGWGC